MIQFGCQEFVAKENPLLSAVQKKTKNSFSFAKHRFDNILDYDTQNWSSRPISYTYKQYREVSKIPEGILFKDYGLIIPSRDYACSDATDATSMKVLYGGNDENELQPFNSPEPHREMNQRRHMAKTSPVDHITEWIQYCLVWHELFLNWCARCRLYRGCR